MTARSQKKLHIAQVATLWFPVPPIAYGGIERVVHLLTEGLIRRGHKVTLFAAPGSKTRAKLVKTVHAPLIAAGYSWSDTMWNLNNAVEAIVRSKTDRYDIIHSHLDQWGPVLQRLSPVPMVHTMHNPLSRTSTPDIQSSRTALFAQEAKRTRVAFVSKAAKQNAGFRFAASPVIWNAVDTDLLQFSPTPKDHLVWIARISKGKGIENAIEAAEQSGAKLHIAGPIDPKKQEYFTSTIAPHLNDRIRYVGEKKYHELAKFYGQAKAFIYPIEWEEPFGLVAAEAMSCGTPVIAYARGAMPEIIEDGVSGFLVEPGDMKGLMRAISKVHLLDRQKVREHAVKKFSVEVMVRAYERFYYQQIKRRGSV